MGRRRAKSELERSVDGLVWSIHIQEAKRPETWVYWITLAVIFGTNHHQWLLALAAVAGLTAVQMALTKRRVGAKDASQVLARLLPEVAAKNARRDLRKGRYDAKVGPETRAILERCAAAANATISASVETHMLNGGGRASLEAFRPLTKSAEAAMRAALTRVQSATFAKRLPDDEALADLRTIEADLAGLEDEAKVLARAYRPPLTSSGDVRLAAERDAARRELDQGA